MSTPVRHSKREAKKQKIGKKQQTVVYSRKEVEQELKNLQDDRSQSQYQDPITKRAMKWWQRQDEKYFKNITKKQLQQARDMLISQKILIHPSITTGQPSNMSNYRQQILQNLSVDKNKLRVLYKNKGVLNSCMYAVYSVQNAITNYQTESRGNLQQVGIRITSKFGKMCTNGGTRGDGYMADDYSKDQRNNDLGYSSRHNQTQMQAQKTHHKYQLQQQLRMQIQPTHSLSTIQPKSIRLQLQQYTDDPLTCNRIQKYQQIQSNLLYLHQIDKELALWEWELQRVTELNLTRWNKMIMDVEIDQGKFVFRDIEEFDKRILTIRDKLSWATVLRSFEHGFKDKTKKMLDIYIENQKNFNLRPPKGIIGHNPKKFFQTDCKICFCSDHSDSNQVLYCDSCNTSFHLACYGLTSVPQQDQYFCQRCTYLKKQQLILGAKPKKPYCQICSKISFPMKKIDDHLYHVTCLVLFNFVQFRQNKMVLKGSLNHENIMKMVIENQMTHQECYYCRKISSGTELGMQIKCCYQRCQNYAHPICAYLNGCKFQLKSTNNKVLNVKMFCNDHLGCRKQQIYLRRYMCNLNQTSSKSYYNFLQVYEKEQQVLLNSKDIIAKNRKKYPNRILFPTRFIKNLFKSRLEKEQEQIETETQRILNQLKKKGN